MGFRDDREALRARADALEAQLRERDDRMKAAEARLDRIEEELATRREMAADVPTEPRKKLIGAPPLPTPEVAGTSRWLRVAPVLGAAALLAVGYAALRSTTPSPPAWDTPVDAAKVGERAEPDPPPEHASAPSPPDPWLTRRDAPGASDVQWRATIASTEGAADLEVGAECLIVGRARALRYAAIHPDAISLTIVCGERQLYSAQEPATGMTSREVTLYEQSSGDEGFHHWLWVSDRGVREGRPEIVIDTPGGTARVFRSDGSLDVRLTVAPRSERRLGPRLLWAEAPPPIGAAHEWDARVVQVEGALDVAPGDRCRLSIEPPPTPNPPAGPNCRVQLRCGRRAVYGETRSGWNHCEVDERGAPLRLRDDSDRDGDPMLDFDREAGTLSLGSASGERSGRAVFELQPVERAASDETRAD